MTGDGRAKILVVDDVPENVRLLEAVLGPRGYDVVSTTEGSAALELVTTANPDLVLLDVVMPEMDGYAVCRRLRERAESAGVPLVHPPSDRRPGKTRADGDRGGHLLPDPLQHPE